MRASRHGIRSRRRLAVAIACTGAFALVACGGGGNGAADSAIEDFKEQISEAATDSGADAGGQSGGGASSGASSPTVQPPTFLLTGDVDVPAGWVADPAGCAGDDVQGPPYFSYHVPPDWNRTGSAYGGAGGVEGSGSHDYELAGGLSLEVEVDTDNYLGTEPLDTVTLEPWVSWDYDITSYSDAGEVTTRATYDELDPVDIDGESVDVWFLDQHQDELIRASEYKARIVFADVPTGGVAGQDRRPYSATVTVGWDADAGDLDEGTVRDVLRTFRVDQCTQEAIVDLFETLNGVTWSD